MRLRKCHPTGDGQKPVVIKQLKPKVRGVLIVARGVENLRIKAAVIEAIQRTLEVPAHRISVLPKG
jgi:stage III sporulation protein AG